VNLRLQLRIMLAALRMSGARGVMALASVALAIAALMVAMGLGRGADSKLEALSDEMGKSLLLVKAGQVQGLPGRKQGWFGSTNLRDADLDLLRANVSAIATIVPLSEASLKLRLGRFDHVSMVRGAGPAYPALRNLELASGRLLDAADENGAARVAVVGAFVAQKLNGGADMLGAQIRINGIPFEVVGQLGKKGLSGTGGNEDDQVLIPTSTARRRLFNANHYTGMLIQARDGARLDAVRERSAELLRQSHGIGPAEKDDFEILGLLKADEIRRQSSRFLRGISQLFAAITLLIGAVGVFAVTLLNVKDRTAEIGLRMALGARRRQIATLFLLEACLLSLLGGMGGLLLGELGLQALRWTTDWAISFDWLDALGAFAVAAALGLVTGVLPAIKASRMMPVLALRSA